MTLALVFNHPSLPYTSIDFAQTGVLDFIRVTQHCRQFGFTLLLVDSAHGTGFFVARVVNSV